jgi:hypothetical protein
MSLKASFKGQFKPKLLEFRETPQPRAFKPKNRRDFEQPVASIFKQHVLPMYARQVRRPSSVLVAKLLVTPQSGNDALSLLIRSHKASSAKKKTLRRAVHYSTAFR